MKNLSLRFLLLIAILVSLNLACLLFGTNPALKGSNPPVQLPAVSVQPEQNIIASPAANQRPSANNPPGQQANQTRFSEADCNISGSTFTDITADYIVDDIYDGAYLSCSLSTTGSHGLSETRYFRIVAYKAGVLNKYYQDLKSSIQGFVDQATTWNAQPDLPESAKDTITFIRDDNEGYIFLISKEANVQGCILGDGYGVESIGGKYLVQLQFSSCEGDAGSYLTALQNLKTTAELVITSAEAAAQH